VEFVVNNKVHLVMKVLSFIANYSRELRTESLSKEKKNRKSDRVLGMIHTHQSYLQTITWKTETEE